MKIKNIIYISVISLLSITIASCKKESANIFNMFTDVTITLDSTSIPHSIGFHNQINDGDSVVFNFTMASAKKDMYQVSIYQVGSAIPFLNIPITDPAKRRNFSYTYKMGPWTGSTGLSTYRIFAYDSAGIYIGDGYKSIAVDVAVNYTFLPNRKLYYPDSTTGTTGTMKCYLSLSTGATYSYTDGAANSADIDLGLYTVAKQTGTTTNIPSIYSLSAPTLPFRLYDISTWTKRATRFSAAQTGQAANFVRNYNSGNRILSYAKGRNPTSTAVSGLASGSAVAFLTPEGKYGILLVNSLTRDSEGKQYIDISIKYQN